MPADETLRIPAKLRPRYDEIVARTDAFANEHLNAEYAELARRMAAALARKRPSPLESAEVRTWAAGIVYAVGWVNFLADPSQDPHMTTAEMAKLAGVGESTIALRFRGIRDALDLVRMDPEWTLPSRLMDHPFAWILLVDGLPMDIRDAPLEVQEAAFRQGMIPFVPGAGPDGGEGRAKGRRGVPRSGREREPRGEAETAPGTDRVYQLKITLQDVRPPVWRRVRVPADTTLTGLHRVIQAAMGWEDRHLWKFEIGGAEYGENLDGGWGEPIRSAGRARLDGVADAGDVLRYEYDFGDSWEHRVRVEKVLPAGDGSGDPECVAAERACPPEDSGGPWGYDHLLEVLADPSHPEHDDMRAWVGGKFDPEAVDLREIDRRLALTRPREAEGGWAGTGPASAGKGGGAPGLNSAAEIVAGEAGAVLRALLEQNPGIPLGDLDTALQTAADSYNTRPQPDLGGLSPVQVHRILYDDPDWSGEVVRVDDSLPFAELEESRTLFNARLFLDVLGERGEVKATPKGNLPRPVVAELHERMRRPSNHRSEWLEGRKALNEEDDFLLHFTRILLDVGGLIKRRKGLYSLTRTGERLREEARAGELFATLFRVHFRRVNLALLDGVEPLPDFQSAITYPLYQFGRVGVDWKTPEELKAYLLLPHVREELPPDEYYDSLEIVLENRLLRPLEGFGLAEVEELPPEPGSWRRISRYRKTSRFDRFLHFSL